jgi:hypothetical protein
VYLQTRVATLRYVLGGLPQFLDADWQQDANLAIIAAQKFIIPRFEQLRTEENIWQMLHSDGQTAEVHSYWGLRQISNHVLPAAKTLSPRPSIVRSIMPSNHHNKWMQRIYRAERWLDVAYKTIEVANLGLQFWQNWKIGREQQRLLQDQRLLLKDSVQATLTGQQLALDQAADPSFVQHYLLERGDDDVYGVLFEDASAAEDKEN